MFSITPRTGRLTFSAIAADNRATFWAAGCGVVTTYTYDDNGNTLSKDDGTSTVTYGYDFENRLVNQTVGSDTTTYTYDVDNIRQAWRDLGIDEWITTTYLIDI